ncbi:6-bladed beta-propeller [Oopsacas minuta]|uniref:6-bladed beta-propeller n=1 Tax=Oopsacas minuta TaxID=111878 RepID=A0AAV7JT35_9METZ|nr:6-bladed beta-propeller [Oopsacas minuta]
MSIREYKSISRPKIKCISKGRDQGELFTPQCLASDPESQNIYIVDKEKKNVNVFTQTGEYLFEFTKIINYLLIGPKCIFVHHQFVLITDPFANAIILFTIEGYYITQIKNRYYEGSNIYLNGPTGIAVDEDDSIYVANCIGNQVLVTTQERPFFSVVLGRIQTHWPHAIKIHKEMIIVLDNLSPCVGFFSKDGEFISRIVTRGRNGQIWRPFSFDIDQRDNMLITDVENRFVRVFGRNGEIIKTFGSKYGFQERVVGIAIDKTNRIISTQQSKINMLIILIVNRMLADIFKTVFIIITGLLFTLIFLVLGWYILWRMFFSRYSFLRELILGQEADSQSRETPVKVRERNDKPIEFTSLSRRKRQNVTF